MTQKTLEKLNRNVSGLREEIKILRSFIIGTLGRDKEGEYRPDFVRRILNAASEGAIFTFQNKELFLKKVRAKS